MINPFTQSERRTLAPTPRLTVSEWADRNRMLPSTDSKPGPWETGFTEYLREPMDAFSDPLVEVIVCVAGAQIGKSRMAENVVGWTVCVDPVDMLFVVPSQDDVGTVSDGRLKPMVLGSPAMVKQTTDSPQDLKTSHFKFRRCSLYLTGANSARGLASKSCGTVILDEVGKFKKNLANEGDPVDLARARTSTFEGRRKIYVTSTPTTEAHGVWPHYKKTDMRRFYVPCPACDHYQHLIWEQVKWPKDVDRKEVIEKHLAYYECEECGDHWSYADKRAAVKLGVWVSEGSVVNPDGTVSGPRSGKNRGYHIPGLLSSFRSFSDFVSLWYDAQGSRSSLGTFFRTTIGIPWADRVSSKSCEEIEEHIGDYEIGEVPEWVDVITAGADIGKHAVHWTIKGWSSNGAKVATIDRGIAATIDGLAEIVEREYGGMPIRKMFVDSGWATDRVYKFCQSRKANVSPCKGLSQKATTGRPLRFSSVETNARGKMAKYGIKLVSVDTVFFKDHLSALMESPDWTLPNGIGEDYIEQITAEHKVLDDATGLEVWEKKSDSGQNHYGDAEIYALAAAYSLGIMRQRSPAKPAKRRPPASAKQETDPVRERRATSDRSTRAGWSSRGGRSGGSRGGWS